MKKVYIFSDDTIEELINDWPLCSQQYKKWIDIIEERTEKIRKAVLDNTPLDNPSVYFIGEDFFKKSKKNLRLYSHRFKDTIEKKLIDKDFSPMSDEHFQSMKQINALAQKLYKQFSDVHNSYEIAEQFYRISFMSTWYSADLKG